MNGVATITPGACIKLPLWSREDVSPRPFTEEVPEAEQVGKVHMKPWAVTDDEAISFLYLSSDTLTRMSKSPPDNPVVEYSISVLGKGPLRHPQKGRL